MDRQAPDLDRPLLILDLDETLIHAREEALDRPADFQVFSYLYDRVVDTVRTDLREELSFLAMFDRAMEGVRKIVDMPDRRAALLIRLMLQNGGRLSNSKRGQFDELTDPEIAGMEQAVQRAVAEAPEAITGMRK